MNQNCKDLISDATQPASLQRCLLSADSCKPRFESERLRLPCTASCVPLAYSWGDAGYLPLQRLIKLGCLIYQISAFDFARQGSKCFKQGSVPCYILLKERQISNEQGRNERIFKWLLNTSARILKQCVDMISVNSHHINKSLKFYVYSTKAYLKSSHLFLCIRT